jgi:hypothetical protein
LPLKIGQVTGLFGLGSGIVVAPVLEVPELPHAASSEPPPSRAAEAAPVRRTLRRDGPESEGPRMDGLSPSRQPSRGCIVTHLFSAEENPD